MVSATGFYSYFTDTAGTPSIVERMISFYSDSIVFPLLIVGFIGALVSTADTFLINSMQMIIIDWQFRSRCLDVGFGAEKFSKKENAKIMTWSNLWILVFGFLAIIVGLLSYLFLEKLSALLFVIFELLVIS